MKALAQFVNAWADGGNTRLSESAARHVSMHDLDADAARVLMGLLAVEGIAYIAVDSAEQEIAVDTLEAGLPPFTLSFAKPEKDDQLYFVSTRAFERWLCVPTPTQAIHVGACERPFSTEGFTVGDWNAAVLGTPAETRRSPRRVVRDATGRALVPSDVRPFLLCEGIPKHWSNGAFHAWAVRANEQLILAVASEVLTDEFAEFVGPPRLALRRQPLTAPLEDQFDPIQAIARWVYDIDREVELRHRLFNQEFTRLAYGSQDAGIAFAAFGASALEGAKIAYGFHIHEISKDALKSLADLRKSVADDTQKLIESMRQVSLGAAGALFYVLGILAAKLTSNLTPSYLEILLLLGMAYIGTVIFVNERAVREQRSLRSTWRKRIYRYLTDDDYKDMVLDPTQRVERLHALLLTCITAIVCVSFASAAWWVRFQRLPAILSGLQQYLP